MADHKVCQGLMVLVEAHSGAGSYTGCGNSEEVVVELFSGVMRGSAEMVVVDMAGLVLDQGAGSWDGMLCVVGAVAEVAGVEHSAVKILNLTEIRHSWLPLREKEYLVVFLGSSRGCRAPCNTAFEKGSQCVEFLGMIGSTHFSSGWKTTVRCLTSR